MRSIESRGGYLNAFTTKEHTCFYTWTRTTHLEESVSVLFDLAIRPRPPRGVVLFAPCSFNSLNKLAHGIADNLALSVVAEAIGRRTPVIVAPSLNQPLLEHPQAQASLRTLPTWGVTLVPPLDAGEGPRLAPTAQLLDAARPFVRQG